MKSKVFASLNLAKLIFIYLIITFHSRLLDGIVNHGYLGVEFFFLVSGFLLHKHYEEKNSSVCAFAIGRIKKLYPHYLFSLIIMLIICISIGEYSKQKYSILAELLWLQNTGVFKCGGLNYPCWYIPVLFWCSVVIYSTLKLKRWKIISIVFIALPLLYYVCSWTIFDGRAEIWNYFHGLYMPMFRGMSEIALGTILYKIYLLLNDKRLNVFVLHCTEILSFTLIILTVIAEANLDVFSVVFMCVFILTILDERSFFELIGKQPVVKFFAELEYPLFLNHALFVVLLRKYVVGVYNIRVAVLLAGLYLAVTLYSYFTNYLVRTAKTVIINKMR